MQLHFCDDTSKMLNRVLKDAAPRFRRDETTDTTGADSSNADCHIINIILKNLHSFKTTTPLVILSNTVELIFARQHNLAHSCEDCLQ